MAPTPFIRKRRCQRRQTSSHPTTITLTTEPIQSRFGHTSQEHTDCTAQRQQCIYLLYPTRALHTHPITLVLLYGRMVEAFQGLINFLVSQLSNPNRNLATQQQPLL